MSQGQFVSRCTADAISSAAASIKDGNLVAFPTETVYGLGADASQGKAVLGGLHNLGLNNVQDVRIGKRITLQVEAADEASAIQLAEEAATKLLANQVMEHFEISIL